MNKPELVEVLAGELNTTKKHAEQAVDALIEIIERTVVSGDKVILSGFGIFEPSVRTGRRGVNPQTGADMMIPDMPTPRFRAGARFKSRLR